MIYRHVRQSALKARKRIASYYNKKVSSKNTDTPSRFTQKHRLFLAQLKELLDIMDKPSSNNTRVQYKFINANKIYDTLIRHYDLLPDMPTFHKTVINKMTQNEIELDDQMDIMTNITRENLSLLEKLEQNMIFMNNKDIYDSIINEINTIRNQTYQYRIYIRDMVQSLSEKITTLRMLLNKNK